MQKIIEFSEKSFWKSEVSVEKLNHRIAELNRDGWRIASITPNIGFARIPRSYMILVESNDNYK